MALQQAIYITTTTNNIFQTKTAKNNKKTTATTVFALWLMIDNNSLDRTKETATTYYHHNKQNVSESCTMDHEDIQNQPKKHFFNDHSVNHSVVTNSSYFIWVIGPFIPEDVEGNVARISCITIYSSWCLLLNNHQWNIHDIHQVFVFFYRQMLKNISMEYFIFELFTE